MLRALALTACLLLTLTGCLRSSRAPELAALLEVAPELMRATPAEAQLPQDQWPAELKALEPKRVYATRAGLYIVTSTFFVHEEGLFLPRSPTFLIAPGTDPEFRRIVDGVYSYKLKG
jgi:hypothetical protein